MTDITFIMGANATGKSTRMKALVDFLGSSYRDYEYTFFDTKKDKTRTINIGRFYPDTGFLILGSEAKNHAGWVCLDKADLSTQDMRTDFYKHVINNDKQVKRIFVEGYFNTVSPRSRPNFLKQTGFNRIDCFYMFYDTPEDYLARTSARAGHDKDLDWAVNSAGWKDNLGFSRAYDKCMNSNEYEPNNGKNVERIDNDASREFLVERYCE